MITVDKIEQLAALKLSEGTNFIVKISVRQGNKIIILLDNDNGISISDCIEMSRYIETNLNREIEDFELNVMSPGLTEPFIVIRQYQKNIGKQVEVITKEGKKISGKILTVNEEGFELETRVKEKVERNKGKQLIISNINIIFNQIKETKLILSF